MKLIKVNKTNKADVKSFVGFINKHYKSKIKCESASITSGKIVGFWVVDTFTKEKLGTCGYMAKTKFLAETVKTVVHSDHRGKGLGEKISTAIEKEVKKAGFKKCMCTIYTYNLPMIFIKLKQGYLFEGYHADHEKPGLHEYSLGKIL